MRNNKENNGSNDGIIDLNATDLLGRTNSQRIEQGLTPIGNDGWPVVLHRVDQTDEGAIMVLPHSLHNKYIARLHPAQSRAAGNLDRKAFGKWRVSYWQEMLKQAHR